MRDGKREIEQMLTFRRGDFIALGIVLLLALGSGLLFFLGTGEKQQITVEICRNGELIDVFPVTQDRRITVEGDYPMTVIVEDEAVWVESSGCPGQDCVHSGRIYTSGQVIVCLPNRVEIRLVGGVPSDVDMVVG